MDKLDEVVADAAAEYRSNLDRLATVAAATTAAPATA